MKNKIIIATKYSVKIAVFLALLVLLNKGLAYLVVDDFDHNRSRMHDFYTQEENISVLLLGSSHSFYSIDIAKLEQSMGKTVFNAGSNNQKIDTSYALLIEAAKSNAIEEVYLELYYSTIDTTAFTDRNATKVSTIYRVTDYMPISFNKINLLLNASSAEYYINSFALAKRYWKYLFELDTLIEIHNTKQSETYQNWGYKTETTEYLGQGFLASYAQLERYVEVSATDFSVYAPSEDWMNTFNAMHAYCQANDIELILYSAAMPVETLASGDYDIYIEQVYNIIEDTDLTYIDFNLAKEELLVTEPNDFFDAGHLNYYGAQKFTEAFYQVYYELENPEDYFYDTFYEKLADLYPEYLEEVTE